MTSNELNKLYINLLAEAEQAGLRPEDLDEAVTDAKCAEAAAINNEGIDSQIQYLVEQRCELDVRVAITRKQTTA